MTRTACGGIDARRVVRIFCAMRETTGMGVGGAEPRRMRLIELYGGPGIGKSTLLLQMASGLLEANDNVTILYVTGEESIDQIRLRARSRITSKGRKP